MADKKYQIFVSSTFEDLKEQRALVTKYILEMGHIPVGMEMFSAGDEEQWNVIKKHIDASDYYVVLVAHRYGSTVNGISYTEKEYDYAIKAKVPTLGFVIDKAVNWAHECYETDIAKTAQLDLFKSKVQSKLVSFWKSPDDLAGKVAISLGKIFSSNPQLGWIKAGANIEQFDVSGEIARLSKENNSLRDEIKKFEQQLQNNGTTEQILRNIKNLTSQISFYYKDGSSWENETQINMAVLFYRIAPELTHESDEDHLSRFIAFCFNPDSRRTPQTPYPIPTNTRSKILSDFDLYGLIEPSLNRKRPASDPKKYWKITQRGKDVLLLYKNRIQDGTDSSNLAT